MRTNSSMIKTGPVEEEKKEIELFQTKNSKLEYPKAFPDYNQKARVHDQELYLLDIANKQIEELESNLKQKDEILTSYSQILTEQRNKIVSQLPQNSQNRSILESNLTKISESKNSKEPQQELFNELKPETIQSKLKQVKDYIEQRKNATKSSHTEAPRGFGTLRRATPPPSSNNWRKTMDLLNEQIVWLTLMTSDEIQDMANDQE